MRFTLGLIVGIVIGRPVANAVNEHLTPPVRRKIRAAFVGAYEKIGNYLYEEEEQ